MLLKKKFSGFFWYLCIMKYIITERQYELINESAPLFIRRRADDIELFVTDSLDETDPEDYNFDEYLDEIVMQVVDKFGQGLSSEKVDQLREYVLDNFSDEIETYYDFDMDDEDY